MNDFSRGLEDKSQTYVIFLDFAKAFDKVSHLGLLEKAYFYGIRGHTFKWIKSFLDNRSQQVMIDGHFSIDAKITSGVPQGSVLGPLLFLIYINDLPNCVQNSVCRLFADDCILYQRIRTSQDIDKLQADLDQLQKWDSIWLMEFNTSKYQAIFITNKIKPIIGRYQVHGHILEQVNCDKYLGIYIDSKQTFNTHVDAIVKKANSTTLPSLPETFLGAVEKSSRWLILPTSDQLWNMLHQCGTHTLSASPTKSKWFNAGVPAMLLATLIAPAV